MHPPPQNRPPTTTQQLPTNQMTNIPNMRHPSSQQGHSRGYSNNGGRGGQYGYDRNNNSNSRCGGQYGYNNNQSQGQQMNALRRSAKRTVYSQNVPGNSARYQKYPPNPKKRFSNWNYCWTCGHDIPDGHETSTCPNPTYGHVWKATKQRTYDSSIKGAHKDIFPDSIPQQQQQPYY